MNNNKWYIKSRFFKKITLSILIVVFSISGLLVSGIYINSKSKIEDISINLYKVSLEQITKNIDMQTNYYDSRLLNIGLKTSTQKFFTKSIDTNNAADRELLLEIKDDSLDVTREYNINQVILYSYKNELILDSSLYKTVDYYNEEYIDYISSLQQEKLDSNFLIEVLDESILLTRAFPIASKKKTGLVSISLKKEAITELTKDSISSAIMLTDRGQEVLRMGDEVSGYTFGPEDISSVIQSENDWNTICFDDTKYYYTFEKSILGNYDFAYFVPYSEFEEVHKSLGTVTLLLVCVMLVVGVLSVLLISNSIYSPIKAVTDYVANESTIDINLFDDELELIKNVYVGISDNNKYMTELLEENKPIVKERFLYRLITGEKIEETEFARKTEYFEIKFPFNYFSVITIEYSIDDDQAYGLHIMNYFSKEMRRNGYTTYVVNLFFQRFSLLICHEKEFDIRELLHSIDESSEHSSEKLFMGIGNSYEGMQNISLSFVKSVEDLEKKSGESLTFDDEQGEVKYNLYQQYFKYEKELFAALVLKSQKKMKEEIELILDELQIQEIHSTDVLRDVFLQLMSTILRVVVESGGDITKVVNEKQLYSDIRKCDNKDGFTGIMNDLCIVVNEYLVHRETGNNQKVVTEVMKIIEEHYQEDLHVAGLAEAVYLSSSHLARIFKKNTGKSINEYIHEIRIKEAKRLLLESNCSVDRIGRDIGYNNIQSFLRNFKKRVGISPNEYRQNNIGNEFKY